MHLLNQHYLKYIKVKSEMNIAVVHSMVSSTVELAPEGEKFDVHRVTRLFQIH